MFHGLARREMAKDWVLREKLSVRNPWGILFLRVGKGERTRSEEKGRRKRHSVEKWRPHFQPKFEFWVDVSNG